jgi:hypothetical protein
MTVLEMVKTTQDNNNKEDRKKLHKERGSDKLSAKERATP